MPKWCPKTISILTKWYDKWRTIFCYWEINEAQQEKIKDHANSNDSLQGW